MTTDADQRLLALWELVDLPEHGYDLALRRYQDLGAWIGRRESSLAPHDAHVFVQGSFAFGTPIRPVIDGEEYDLDFTCKLREGVARQTHTQAALKKLIGDELAAYRAGRNIQKPLVEKNRCWRLGYKDELPFHLDVVPGIPADVGRRQRLVEAMKAAGLDALLAQEASRRALWITDLQDANYRRISDEWPSSNPGGYQLWFRSRMQPELKRFLAEAQVDPVPVFRSKSPLQQVIQLLKRHRDVMFQDDVDRKPASILITTVAGAVFVPGESISQCLRRILTALDTVCRTNTDGIPNPVNPAENFADRWTRRDCLPLQLKANFHRWVAQAIRDFGRLLDDNESRLWGPITEDAFKLEVPEATRRRLGLLVAAPALVRSVKLQAAPAPPWAD